MRFLKWRFFVLPRAFTVHVPHPKSKSNTYWKTNRDQKAATERLYSDFLSELKSRGVRPTLSEAHCAPEPDPEVEASGRRGVVHAEELPLPAELPPHRARGHRRRRRHHAHSSS